MAKQKSVRDIINQRNRIQQELINRVGTTLGSGQFSTRYQRTADTSSRYVNNVERKIGSTLNSMGRWNGKADIPVSRRVYMGLTAG